MRSRPFVLRRDAGTTPWWGAAVALSVVAAAIGVGSPDAWQTPAAMAMLRQVGLMALCVLAWSAPALSNLRHRFAARAVATGVTLQLAADVWEQQVAIGLGLNGDLVHTGQTILYALSGACLAVVVASLAGRHRRHGAPDWRARWDATLVGAAASFAAWESPAFGMASGRLAPGPAVAVASAVLVATAFLVRLMLTAAWRLVAIRLIAVAVVVSSLVVLQATAGGAVFSGAAGPGWSRFAVVLVCGAMTGAVLHPSFRRLVDDGPPPPAAPRWTARAVTLSAAVVGPSLVLALRALTAVGGSPADAAVTPSAPLALAAVAIALGVSLRLVHLLREHDRTQRLLRHWRVRDELTGLPNRAYVLDHLRRKVGRLRTSPAHAGPGIGVLLVDLDGFRAINDTYGHIDGDAVLVDVAHRLVDTVRSDDVVGRTAGDEFVVVCNQPSDRASLELLADRLREVVETPLPAAFGVVSPRVSIGIVAVDHSVAAEDDAVGTILRQADARLREAKTVRRTPITPDGSPPTGAPTGRRREGADAADGGS